MHFRFRQHIWRARRHSGRPARRQPRLCHGLRGPTATWTRCATASAPCSKAPQAEVFLVATGSAANALACASFCPAMGRDLLPPVGAYRSGRMRRAGILIPAGAKLTHVAGDTGKIDPEALAQVLAQACKGVVHHVQPGMVSLTNLTECGTRYSVSEITALAQSGPCPWPAAASGRRALLPMRWWPRAAQLPT